MSSRNERNEDIEELREVLSTISEFISGLRQPIKEFLDMLMSSLNGEKLGKEVAALYRELKESGMPEEMIREIVNDFFKKKMESAPNIATLTRLISNALSGGKPKFSKTSKEVREGLTQVIDKELRELEERLPEEHREHVRRVRERLSKQLTQEELGKEEEEEHEFKER